MTDVGQVFSSAYGWLLCAKTAAFIALGVLGRLHRRRTVADLRQNRPRSFLRLALAEVAIMAVVIGLAVALSRTAPPVTAAATDPVRDLLGYVLPPEITLPRLAVA
ncbi:MULTISPECIES: CopD family protein [Streptosporangium]|uniref:Copper export protein n=1 Tax=Streptosporangium brasiliense TaxID=47480 RepID=A0ABT9RHL3_9ACTN|nr:CopD family protein [Streptosporangium brasiliense]MDP9867845.1 putative copper export protein [Streptosporangium brasiliense]